ncbi:hypothetical protein [Bacillus mycoides]|uniref:hypothetical protein n=1 Tax=Bacillus mycoides TaxID=1405 RepID=UPI0020788752|nr:hypothetical protein [Bacillus mycoides]
MDLRTCRLKGFQDFWELYYSKKNDFICNEVLTASEASEILGVKRARMNQLIKERRLNP